MHIKGRGALSNIAGRFAKTERVRLEPDEPGQLETELRPESTRKIITTNTSPDVPFEQSINPYKGCEHGCIYCFARRTHSFLDLSPGRDFETKIFYKPNAVELLRAELTRPGYQVSPIALGMNTDAWQPAEKTLRITRDILLALLELKHPVSLITKSALILRDIDVLEALAELDLVAAAVSLTTLDDELKRRMEPRTAGPAQRLKIVRELSERGIPTSVLIAPLIPALNDHELERMVESAAAAGAMSVGYVLLRLPDEVRPLFVEWIETHYPDRAAHVLSLIRQMRSGRLNDPDYHSRQTGRGPFAELIRSRFEKAIRRHGLADRETHKLNTTLFEPPRPPSRQLEIF